MIIVRIVSIIYCIFCIQNVGRAQADSLKAGVYHQQADQLLLKGKPNKAIKYYRKALGSNDKLTAAWRSLGICYELLEEYDSTIVHYQYVIALNPNFSRVLYYELGRSFYRLGAYQQALDYFYLFEKLQKEDINDFGFNGEKEQSTEKEYLRKLPSSIRACKNALELQNFSNVVEIHNLGDSINTANNEYFPFISNDQKQLFYTASLIDPSNRTASNEDLFFSQKDKQWSKGKILSALMTTSQNEGMSTFTRDGRVMIYTACQQDAVLADGCDLRKALIENDSLIAIETLSGNPNTAFWESQAAISCDGSQLYFASNRGGGLGLTDIWLSQRLADGTWSEPKNLGSNINTKGYEEAPFITNDGKTLFFSSTGRLGMGEQDIYMSHWNEEGYWEAAINIGPPINTAARELGFFLTSDNQLGYFASNRTGGFGGMDIYKFQMPAQFEVEPITFVEGFVRDSISHEAIETYIKTEKYGTIKTDKNGRFFFCLPSESTLSTRIDKENYLFFQKAFDIPLWNNQTLYQIELLLHPKISQEIKESKPVLDTTPKKYIPVLHTVYFDFNDFGLNRIASKYLNKLLLSFKQKSIQKVEVFGFADVVGLTAYNLDLSKKRAENVAKYLKLNGFSTEKIMLIGKGENNDYDQNHLNRRVEIKLYVEELVDE